MKKILSIILLSAILLTGNIAFVQGSTLTTAAVNYRAKLVELVPLQAKIRADRTEILTLKASATKAYNKAKVHIKSLSKNKDNLTPAQLEAIKESLNSIRQDKLSLSGTIGKIEKGTLALKTGKSEKNFAEVTNSLNDIIAVQNTRIENLQRIITDLNKSAAL